MFRLDGKVAVIIGGAGGLGEACALAYARQGAKVALASRDLAKLTAAAQQIQSETGSEAVALQVDVTNEESIAKLVQDVLKKFGTVDILLNAQGINVKKPPVEFPADQWDAMFAVNVRGVMMACKHFGKVMIEKQAGKIINLSSVRGIRGTGGGNVGYGATKGAVDMITKMLAAEYAPYNVTVNAVGPSIVMTEMAKKSIDPERIKMIVAKNPIKRLATPEDVAGAAVYLASSAADFVTGQILYVDGGLTAVA